MKTKEEIKEILESARDLHLESVEIEGIKYTLGKNIGFPRKAHVEELKAEEMVKPLSPLDEMTDEEIMYWATPYGVELEARKLSQQNQKQEEDQLRATA